MFISFRSGVACQSIQGTAPEQLLSFFICPKSNTGKMRKMLAFVAFWTPIDV